MPQNSPPMRISRSDPKVSATAQQGFSSLRLACLRYAVLTVFLIVVSCPARADDKYPLRPADMSSPRATLYGFIKTTDNIYRRLAHMMEGYSKSGRLFLSAEERQEQVEAISDARTALQFLDLSGIAPVLRDTVAIERALELKEILDRIEVPAEADVPNREEMARLNSKRWRLPNTEIDFVLIERDRRAGDYLVSSETVDRLPEFYQRVKEMPYKPGPGQDLAEAYRSISHGGSATIYDAFLNSPTGLSYVIPPRWMLNLPNWAKARLAGVAVWQWLGFGLGVLVIGLVVVGGHRLTRRRAYGDRDQSFVDWRLLLPSLATIFVAGVLIPVLSTVLRIGGTPHIVIDYAMTGTAILGLAWLAVVASGVLGEVLGRSEHLTARSLDSHLIRLGMRLIGIGLAVAVLIWGRAKLGFSTYSILAGLGIGGLAVALAAQSTVANLIGSLLIVLEKPFRVGHFVRIGTSEGTVEDVGFRSTRIRTPDNTLISIPSSTVVSSTVENLSLRVTRRQRFLVQVTYDTPRKKVEALVTHIKQLIVDHPCAEDSTCFVNFNNLGESSLDIQVIFYLRVDDFAAELREREIVLLKVMDLVSNMGAEFAFPTRTLQITGDVGTWPRGP